MGFFSVYIRLRPRSAGACTAANRPSRRGPLLLPEGGHGTRPPRSRCLPHGVGPSVSAHRRARRLFGLASRFLSLFAAFDRPEPAPASTRRAATDYKKKGATINSKINAENDSPEPSTTQTTSSTIITSVWFC